MPLKSLAFLGRTFFIKLHPVRSFGCVEVTQPLVMVFQSPSPPHSRFRESQPESKQERFELTRLLDFAGKSGSPPAKFDTNDAERTYFIAELPIHPAFMGPSADQVEVDI
jgi:hypothetical protein